MAHSSIATAAEEEREAGPVIGSPEWIAEYSLSTRTACRKAQLDIARADERVFSIEGDLGQYTVPFHAEFPRRFLQMGIAEADMVGTAAGLAMRGKIPFVNSFAAFLAFRACEQVRLEVAYHRSNVKLVGSYAGISGGAAAGTHHSYEDMAVVRAMPNVVLLSPADSVETWKATWGAYAHEGPVYLRVGRAETPQVYFGDYEFEIGKAVRLREGSDITLIASGARMVWEALEAGTQLAVEGIGARVLNIHTLKPLDREAITAAAMETGAVVTVEDHSVIGGLGCAVAEVVLTTHPAPVMRVGLPDCFCETVGTFEEMLPAYGMDARAIVAAAHRALVLKGRRG
ncbi:MAG TPA: transketolase C-terminal domain-containing protein [Thermoanaerobaculia bacterium]|nr:transketolase C-terminal domain-containing protein [Thermoanaerobaculia bacterium]